MLTLNTRKLAAIAVSILFLIGISFGAVILDTVRYERPVRAIRGKVTGGGQVVPIFWVDVYDNAQVWLDDSMPMAEKRKRQTKVALVEPNERGEFNIKHLPRGFYEVEFGNHYNGGYNSLSVLVNVDPNGTRDKLCADVSLEGGGGQSTVSKCSAR